MRTPPLTTRPSLPASRRGHRPCALVAASLAVLASLAPVAAHAETRDPGEIGHAIVFFGTFLLLFLGSLALAVWMIIARLRGAATPSDEPPVPTPDLDRLWFPTRPSKRPRSP
jgi:hypothetical protein